MGPWQKRGLVAAGAVLAGAGLFVGGRFSAPLKVETRDVIKTVYQDRVQIVEKRVEVAGSTKVETRVVYRDVIRKPDGTVIDHTVTKTGDTEAVKVTSTDDSTKVEAVSASTLQEHTQTVTLRPDWSVSLMVGGSIPKPWLTLYGPLVVGVEVDRRILGGFSIGVWINTGGSAGGALKFEF